MRRTFSDYIRKNKELDNKAVRFFQRAVKKYPYSQPLRMLYAKSLQNTGHESAEKEIQKAEAYAPDRHTYRTFILGEAGIKHEKYIKKQGQEENVQSTADAAEKVLAELNSPKTEGAQKENGDSADQHQDDKKHNKTVQKQAIIDRFLSDEPRIKPNPDDIPAGQLSPESIEDDPELVSETLAELHAKQGRTDRAIAIYEKLSLMFPEKSSYFAKKIESVKKEIN